MSINKFLYFTLLYVITIFFIHQATVARGHGLGLSLENEAGEYFIDIGANLSDLITHDPVRFEFLLWNKDKTLRADFTSVLVRIAPKDKYAVFAGSLHRPEFGPTLMTHTFPKPGNYELTVKYFQQDKILAEKIFPLTVTENSTNAAKSALNVDNFIAATIGLMVGGAITWQVSKRKREI